MCAIQRMGHWIKWPFVCRPPLGNFPQVMSEWKERFRSLVSSFITLEVLMAASSVSALLDRISVLTLPSFPWDWSSQKAATDNVKGTTRTRPKKYSVGILIILTCFVQQDEISSVSLRTHSVPQPVVVPSHHRGSYSVQEWATSIEGQVHPK